MAEVGVVLSSVVSSNVTTPTPNDTNKVEVFRCDWLWKWKCFVVNGHGRGSSGRDGGISSCSGR